MISDIQRPTLLLDPAKVRRNIERMAEKASRAKVRFRPHFKTHQSAAVGEWFRPFGVREITVSSVDMAEYFAGHGWNDITIAFPVNLGEAAALDRLAGRVRLGLRIESEAAVPGLDAALTSGVDVWLKIDVGAGRTGIPWTQAGEASRLAARVREAPRLRLRGLLTHAGHSYRARGPAEIEAVHRDQTLRMRAVRDRLAADGIGGLEISVGDMPGCSVVQDLSGPDEIRPGNFVLYDLMQLELGACREDDIAAVLACPVVAKRDDPRRAVIHGGAIHLSLAALPGPGGPVYGRLARLDGTGWRPLEGRAVLASLSQEHGIVSADDEAFRRIRTGEPVAVLPVHSCLTVSAMRGYRTLDGQAIPALGSGEEDFPRPCV